MYVMWLNFGEVSGHSWVCVGALIDLYIQYEYCHCIFLSYNTLPVGSEMQHIDLSTVHPACIAVVVKVLVSLITLRSLIHGERFLALRVYLCRFWYRAYSFPCIDSCLYGHVPNDCLFPFKESMFFYFIRYMYGWMP